MRIAVCLHLYYVDLFHEIDGYIKNLYPHPFDLYVTLPRENKPFLPTLRQAYPNAIIIPTSNVGFDIFPFLQFVEKCPLEKYDIVFKIHTKKNIPIDYSLNGVNLSGNLWRKYLLNAILGSQARVNHILEIMERQQHIGMLGAKELLIIGRDKIAEDLDINALHSVMSHYNLPIRSYEFIAGSMFAVRSYYLSPLKKYKYKEEDFPPYFPRNWNSLPYCLERVFGCMISSQGSQVAGLPQIEDKSKMYVSSDIQFLV